MAGGANHCPREALANESGADEQPLTSPQGCTPSAFTPLWTCLCLTKFTEVGREHALFDKVHASGSFPNPQCDHFSGVSISWRISVVISDLVHRLHYICCSLWKTGERESFPSHRLRNTTIPKSIVSSSMANQDSLRNGVHNEEVASTTTNSATVNTCDKIEVGSINVPIANMPPTAQSQPSEPLEIAERLVDKFNQALSGKQSVDLSELFLEDCHWRDHLCLSWDLRTYTGREQISQRLQQDHNLTKILVDNSTAYRAPQIAAIDAFGDVNGIQFFINASTQAGHGRGVVRLAESENSWKIFTLSTMLQGLEDYPEPLNEHRSLGAEHGGKPERKNWSEKREADADFTEASPDVLIIGIVEPIPNGRDTYD